MGAGAVFLTIIAVGAWIMLFAYIVDEGGLQEFDKWYESGTWKPTVAYKLMYKEFDEDMRTTFKILFSLIATFGIFVAFIISALFTFRFLYVFKYLKYFKFIFYKQHKEQ